MLNPIKFLEPYKVYIRVFLATLIVFLSLQIGTFTREKDPELMVYFNKGLGVINAYCKEDQYYYPFMTSVTFGKMPISYTVAFCSTRINGFKLVFDKKYWDGLSNVDKTQLMYHEMIHCMFNENHSEDPTHFMYFEMREITSLSLAMQLHSYLTNKCGEPNGSSK